MLCSVLPPISLQLPVALYLDKRQFTEQRQRLRTLPILISRRCGAYALQERTARRRRTKEVAPVLPPAHEVPGRDGRWLIFSTQPSRAQ
jgi:hypothetical protein